MNHIIGLGKSFDIDELNIKVLKSLDKTWQPKVTMTSKSQNLNTMSMTTLFRKLERTWNWSWKVEWRWKKKVRKRIWLSRISLSNVDKGKSGKEDEELNEEEENMSLFIKRLSKFMKFKGKKRFKKWKEGKSRIFLKYHCYGCEEKWHLRTNIVVIGWIVGVGVVFRVGWCLLVHVSSQFCKRILCFHFPVLCQWHCVFFVALGTNIVLPYSNSCVSVIVVCS